MVTWQDHRIKTARLSAAGVVSPPRVISTQVADYSWPSIAGLGTNYFITHVGLLPGASNAWVREIRGTLLARDGSPLRSVVVAPNRNPNPMLPVVDYTQDHPSVTAHGSGYVVTWQKGDIAHGERRFALDNIFGARVNLEGTPQGQFLICTAPQEQSYPRLAWNGASFLVAWQDARLASSSDDFPLGSYDVYGAQCNPSGQVLQPGGYLISSLVPELPTLTWPTPADIVYGTPLGSAQLNATASVPGSFAYSPPAGTVLNAGSNQVLSVRFAPADAVNYAPVEASAALTVQQAALTIRADDKTKFQGQPNPPLTATYSGFVTGDTPACLDVPVTLTTAATTASPPGNYPIAASGARDLNYNITHLNGNLAVLPAGPISFVRREIKAGGAIRLIATPATQVSVYAVEDRPPTNWAVRELSHGGVFDTHTGKVKFGPFFDHESRTLTYQVTPPPGAQGVFAFVGTASADGVNSPITGDQHFVLASWHPAELRQTQPADWKMSIEEVTAYASAWRRGLSWMLPPNPIPIDYVTRAATLWRRGECYTVNPAITNPPLWWVPCPGGSGIQAGQGPDGNPSLAERRLPLSFVPGQSLTLSVIATPAAGTTAFAVEEQIPDGWTVTVINGGGEHDALNRKIKWGPFFDAAARTLTCELVPPSTAGSVAVWKGAASFDGASVPVAGTSELRPEGSLRIVRDTATGRLLLSVAGPAGSRYRVECSADLVNWVTLLELAVSPEPAAHPVDTSPQKARRFYRARRIQ
jgi:hypothetical protein